MTRNARFEAPETGDLIRYWRKSRGLSQMGLALDVGISARHMSFVETGRSRPSRGLVLRIAERLRIPAREENLLLETAGHARQHLHSDPADPALRHAMKALRFLLDRHDPNSALVFDRDWDIVMHNEAHRRARDFFAKKPELPPTIRDNLLRLTFHPDGLRHSIVNWAEVAAVLLARVERELEEAPSARRLRALSEEVRSYGPLPDPSAVRDSQLQVLLPLHLCARDVEVRVFTVLSTLGAALDVTLQELRLETFFPVDAASERALHAIAAPAAG